jgi:hypothetical protein
MAMHLGRSSDTRNPGATALCLVVYVVLAVGAFWHVWHGHPTSDMQLGGDQWRNVWFLAWVPYAIGHGLDPLYSGFGNAPVGVNLLTGAGVPILGFVFAPVTLVWGPVATFNVVSTLALAGSATAGYFLVRRFTTWRSAAFFGGLLYGFSPAIVAQAMDGHVNLSFEVLPPLILLVLHELVIRQHRLPRWQGILLGVLVAAQFFVSSEILLDTAVVAVVAAIAAAVVGRAQVGDRLRHARSGLIAAAATVVVLLAWPVWFLLAGPAHVSGKLQLVPEAYRSDVAGVLIPDTNQRFTIHSLVAHADHFSTTPGENGAYLGITLILVLAAGFVLFRRDRTVIVAGIAAAGAFILSLGGALTIARTPSIGSSGQATGSIPLPEAIFSHLPVVDNVVPGRYAILVDLCLAVVFGVIVERVRDEVLRRRPTPAGAHRRTSGRQLGLATALPAVVAVVALLPLAPTAPFSAIGFDGTPPAFRTDDLRMIPAGSVSLMFPFPSNAYPEPLLWQAETDFRFRMPGGYYLVPQGPQHHLAFSGALGYAPDSPTGELLTSVATGDQPAHSPALRASILAQLRAWGVTSVIATTSATTNPTTSLAFLEWVLGPPTTTVKGSDIWTSVPG